jgi:hypothetical protein
VIPPVDSRMHTLDPDFGEAFTRSLGLFLDAMDFQGGVEVREQQIAVHLSSDLVVYLDIRAVRRVRSRPRRPVRRRHLTLLAEVPTGGGEAG